jgi:NAD(P)H-dependent flavin oxidoreductase YrpB (nitropropane dioxygenase family)
MMANREGSQAWMENRLTSRLGLKYPIIQGPLGGLSSQRLTAAVSNYGGLGSFGAHGLKPEAIRNVIREIKNLTSKPFSMNLWVSMEDEGALTSTEEAFDRSLAPLTTLIESVGGVKPFLRVHQSTVSAVTGRVESVPNWSRNSCGGLLFAFFTLTTPVTVSPGARSRAELSALTTVSGCPGFARKLSASDGRS